MDLVGVFSSIEDQHMNIVSENRQTYYSVRDFLNISFLQLKAFYVDFILPIENNIEKDTKVVQLEQKKFVQLHKQRIESFNKGDYIIERF